MPGQCLDKLLPGSSEQTPLLGFWTVSFAGEKDKRLQTESGFTCVKCVICIFNHNVMNMKLPDTKSLTFGEIFLR